jgi:hypothetical protein
MALERRRLAVLAPEVEAAALDVELRPSGFIANTIQISRVSTIEVIRGLDP